MQRGFAHYILVLIVVGIVAATAVWVFVAKNNSNLAIPKDGDQIACTQDAMQCPDGSFVGRSGPKCEFTACPSSDASSSADLTSWKTYTNTSGGYSVKYPNDYVIDETLKNDPQFKNSYKDTDVDFVSKKIQAIKGYGFVSIRVVDVPSGLTPAQAFIGKHSTPSADFTGNYTKMANPADSGIKFDNLKVDGVEAVGNVDQGAYDGYEVSVIKNGKLYSLRIDAYFGEADKGKPQRQVFDDMVTSFKFN